MPSKKIALPDGVHSKIGPSSSDRWINCPGSVALTDKLVKLGRAKFAGSAAKEGTAAHSVLAACLMNGNESWAYAGQEITVEGETFTVDSEMTTGIQESINFVMAIMAKYEKDGALLFVENMLSSVLDEEAFGTGDVVIIVPGKLIIILDFKYGQGVTVEPDDSQLSMYSYMAWEMFGAKYFTGMDSVPVEQWIMQPRIPHARGTNRGHHTDTAKLTEWFVGEVIPAMQETRNPNALFKTGSHCHFCPARNACPALRADTMNLEVNRDPVSMTADELGETLERVAAIKKYGEKLEEEALNRARQGEKIAGYKLVKKQGKRIWKETLVVQEENPCDPDGDPIEVIYSIEEFLLRHFKREEVFTAPEMVGPATIDDLPGGSDITARASFTPDTGTTLAPRKDKRPESRPLIALLDSVVIL